jgi:hypothetical protein
MQPHQRTNRILCFIYFNVILSFLPFPHPKQQPCTHTEYVVTLSERLDKINKLASNQMALVRERQKRQYDIKINKTQHHIGSLVWLHDPTKKKGLCRKLQLPWEGPYQVMQILSDLVYAIQLDG